MQKHDHDPDVPLSRHEAYLAMFEYLRQHYERGPLEEIGNLLSDLQLLPNGTSADPAAYRDWLKAVEVVKVAEATSQGYRAADFRLSK